MDSDTPPGLCRPPTPTQKSTPRLTPGRHRVLPLSECGGKVAEKSRTATVLVTIIGQ
jgi:hypothetical protein